MWLVVYAEWLETILTAWEVCESVHNNYVCSPKTPTLPPTLPPSVPPSLRPSLPLSSSFLPPSVDHAGPVTGLDSTPGSSHFLSHSEHRVRGWRVQQLYERSAIIGRGTWSLSATTHPLVPTRLLASCRDSTIRLVSPTGGHVITTALLPPGRQIASLAYFSLAGEETSATSVLLYHHHCLPSPPPPPPPLTQSCSMLLMRVALLQHLTLPRTPVP